MTMDCKTATIGPLGRAEVAGPLAAMMAGLLHEIRMWQRLRQPQCPHDLVLMSPHPMRHDPDFSMTIAQSS